MISALSDEALLEHYRAESSTDRREACINELFGRHQKRLALWCLRMTSDRETARDLAQEVAARAFERLDGFRGQCKFTSWLYVIARNHCLNYLKSMAARPSTEGSEALERFEDGSQMEMFMKIEERGHRNEIWKLFRDTVTEDEARVMVLHYAHELPLKTVTDLLGLANPSGAKAYIVSAKRKLGPALMRWRARKERVEGASSTPSGDRSHG